MIGVDAVKFIFGFFSFGIHQELLVGILHPDRLPYIQLNAFLLPGLNYFTIIKAR